MMPPPDYLLHADRVAAEIRGGTRPAGQKLPPLRRYAFEQGIAVSTAARVYAELVRQGLTSGEVGRGTFVRALPAGASLSEPGRDAVIDLEFNATGHRPEDMAILADAMSRLASSGHLCAAAASASAYGHTAVPSALATHLSRGGWTPDSGHILLAGGGRHGIAGAFAALAEPGAAVGLEATTYPMAKAIAHRLGLPAIPLAMDGEGILPDAVARAHGDQGVKLIYVQPSVHNPLGMTMGHDRRRCIADYLNRHDLILIEDAVYGFLDPEAPPPIAALAPDKTVLIDSFSKRGLSGVPVGFVVVASPVLRRRVATSLRSGAWLAAPINVALFSTMLESGALPQMEARKRAGAVERQHLVRSGLEGWPIEGGPHAYHVWLRLPPPWRAEAFGAAALRAGVAVTPAQTFSVQAGYAPDAVRLAFATPPLEKLKQAVERLAALLHAGPGETPFVD